jgi:hypothetical protein
MILVSYFVRFRLLLEGFLEWDTDPVLPLITECVK